MDGFFCFYSILKSNDSPGILAHFCKNMRCGRDGVIEDFYPTGKVRPADRADAPGAVPGYPLALVLTTRGVLGRDQCQETDAPGQDRGFEILSPIHPPAA